MRLRNYLNIYKFHHILKQENEAANVLAKQGVDKEAKYLGPMLEFCLSPFISFACTSVYCSCTTLLHLLFPFLCNESLL